MLRLATLACLLVVALFNGQASCGAIEDAVFDFDNDGYVASPYSYFRGHDEPNAYPEAAAAADEDDEDEQDSDAADDEPTEGEPMMVAKEALESLFQGKSVAPTPSSVEKHRSYCHPPNPCPKGHTPAANGCQEGVKDSAEWNRLDQERNMRMGKCACDVEHMFTCPPGVPTVSVATAKQASQQEQQQMAQQKLVRKKKSADMMDFNVDGHKTIAKKSPPFV